MATSTVLATKQALLALLQASTALGAATPPVAVWWDRPNWDHDVHENVYITDVTETQDWAQLGGQRRDEVYTVNVETQVYREGSDPQGAETRLWALVAAIETAVKADVTLTQTVVDAHVSSIRQTSDRDREGYLYKAVIGISVHARI